MAYRWSLEGPAFEFPTPYGTENRFLVWRGYALIGLALLIVLVVSFVGGEDTERPVVILDKLPEQASVVPHLLGAMLLTVLGALDLLQAAARRTLLLAPGQPASLMSEVAREASGVSPGAAGLQRLLEVGAVSQVAPAGPYAGWLQSLAPELGAAPGSLHEYLRHRLAHGALAAGLAGLLLLAVVVVRNPPALALMSFVLAGACALALARHLLQPHQAALAPWLVAGLVVLAVAAGGALGWFADLIPRAASLPKLGLPVAAAVLLASVLLFELVGILAARAQLQAPWLAAVPAEETRVDFEADPEQLLREVDLELHRQWTEGVPNRRYAWQGPQFSRGAEQGAEHGSYQAVVLEESQPLVPHTGRDIAPAAVQSPARTRGLLWLDGLGLVWSLTGGVLWVWLALAHMRDVNASWVPGAAGLACLLAGAYALRVGHLLWSRVEVQSTLTWLDFQGRYLKLTDAVVEGAGRSRGEPPVRVEDLHLRARVAVARSVFYAAAPHPLGSRVLLALGPHRGGASAWLQMLQAFARQAVPSAAAAPVAAARPRGRAPGAADVEAPPPRRPARFCPHCGTPVLSGARFCQHCGSVLAGE
ncbi:MAG: zinc ribbon domain-containing protein [Rubrivivax sp.]|nr:zinc ribbon domain-containing protein [Rubrivivax sp.]